MLPHVYRVTTYDPTERDEHGHYTGDESTTGDHGPVEAAYLQAIAAFAEDTGIDRLAVHEPHIAGAAHVGPEPPVDGRGLASLVGELAMGSERFRRLWARADVRARTHGPKVYRHPLVGPLELHHENFALPDDSGMELLVLSAAPAAPPRTACACSRAWARTAVTRAPP